jgi:hypothetical protein
LVFYAIAAKQGSADAGAAHDRLAGELSETQIAQANARVAAWCAETAPK